MALLIDIGIPGWMEDSDLAGEVRALLPDADVRTRANLGDVTQIRMLAVSSLAPDLPAQLPNLELVQKLGAGVETIVNHPALPPRVRVARLKPVAPAQEIAEFCLAYILRGQRNMAAHENAQTRHAWEPVEPRYAPDTTVGVLGLGHIGGCTASLLRHLGFRVIGWARSAKSIDGVDCRHGGDALAPMLAECDYVAAILPSTTATRGLFDAQLLNAMKPGSLLINAGRGDLIDETALIDCLNTGPLAGAVLDVLSTEPLPPENPLWAHPGVTITPHVSGWHLGDALKDVAENYRRLIDGTPLLHEVDRARGY
ncbi:MAG: glyoxylate/hydroxypyruvate reductase A [Paracoccaceae bacterium]|jgi:glyoxylate/hydroxypyruvate reductase A